MLINIESCHLVINNYNILKTMNEFIKNNIYLIKYLLSYTWLILYSREYINIDKVNINSSYIFNINTAALLPKFPILNNIKLNPYIPLLFSNNIFEPTQQTVSSASQHYLDSPAREELNLVSKDVDIDSSVSVQDDDSVDNASEVSVLVEDDANSEIEEEIWEEETADDLEPENVQPAMEKMVAHCVMGIYIHASREHARHNIREKLKFQKEIGCLDMRHVPDHNLSSSSIAAQAISSESQSQSQSQSSQGGESITFSIQSDLFREDLVEASLNNLRLILSIDGEHFQLQAVDYFAKLDKYSNIEFFKWAASCSFFQQPNGSNRLKKNVYNQCFFVVVFANICTFHFQILCLLHIYCV
jgi:hypothetical protein